MRPAFKVPSAGRCRSAIAAPEVAALRALAANIDVFKFEASSAMVQPDAHATAAAASSLPARRRRSPSSSSSASTA